MARRSYRVAMRRKCFSLLMKRSDGVVRDADFSGALGRDHRLGVSLGNEIAGAVAVIGAVANDALGLDIGQKFRHGGEVVCLAAGEQEA